MSEYLSPHTIRRAMLVKGVSVESLAFKVGVSPQTIYRLLHGGNLRTATIVRIAQTLAQLPNAQDPEVVDEVLGAEQKK